MDHFCFWHFITPPVILQVVMGWYNYHLYQFVIDGTYYSDLDNEGIIEVKNARRRKLKDVVGQEKKRFIYLPFHFRRNGTQAFPQLS